jgi:hypothetical protein
MLPLNIFFAAACLFISCPLASTFNICFIVLAGGFEKI